MQHIFHNMIPMHTPNNTCLIAYFEALSLFGKFSGRFNISMPAFWQFHPSNRPEDLSVKVAKRSPEKISQPLSILMISWNSHTMSEGMTSPSIRRMGQHVSDGTPFYICDEPFERPFCYQVSKRGAGSPTPATLQWH